MLLPWSMFISLHVALTQTGFLGYLASCLKMPAAAAMGTARGREMTGKICFISFSQQQALDSMAAARLLFGF